MFDIAVFIGQLILIVIYCYFVGRIEKMQHTVLDLIFFSLEIVRQTAVFRFQTFVGGRVFNYFL